MQVKIFEFSKSVFSWSWKISSEEIEMQISAWLDQHPDIQIESIQHSSFASFWSPPQLLVSIYYR